eukprot:jgi/Orpsp1_1/1185689/evm.model.c7180000094856.1
MKLFYLLTYLFIIFQCYFMNVYAVEKRVEHIIVNDNKKLSIKNINGGRFYTDRDEELYDCTIQTFNTYNPAYNNRIFCFVDIHDCRLLGGCEVVKTFILSISPLTERQMYLNEDQSVTFEFAVDKNNNGNWEKTYYVDEVKIEDLIPKNEKYKKKLTSIVGAGQTMEL